MDKRKDFLERLKAIPVPEKTIEGENGLPDFLTQEGIQEKVESFERLLKSGIIDKATKTHSTDGEER